MILLFLGEVTPTTDFQCTEPVTRFGAYPTSSMMSRFRRQARPSRRRGVIGTSIRRRPALRNGRFSTDIDAAERNSFLARVTQTRRG
ncbi:MAG: hypothetical protein IPI11_13625 [Haliscomenobacter sp.]|nr:hypothetical protein [Haliscomenobacter sp.]